MLKLPTKLSDRAIKAEGLWSFGNMVWTIIVGGAGMVSGLTSWLLAQTSWFWNAYGLSGVWLAGLVAFGLVAMVFRAIAVGLNAFDARRHRRAGQQSQKTADPDQTSQAVPGGLKKESNGSRSPVADIRPKVIPMDAAIRYISRESQWIVDQQNNPHWGQKLQQDLHDALRQGVLTAFGRVAQHNRIPPDVFKAPMQPIGNRTWQHSFPSIMDGLIGNRTLNAAMVTSMVNTIAYYDIHFDAEQVMTLWPILASASDSSIKPLAYK
jgi:hypothetical protein